MKRWSKTTVGAAGAVLLSLLIWIFPVQADDPHSVRLTGSQYLVFSLTDMARWYTQDQPEAKVSVSSGDYHSYVESLVERTADAVMCLGKLDDDSKAEAAENGIQLIERVIGWGAVALVTDSSNPIQELSLEQVRKIFVGEIRNWQEVGGLDQPIVPMTRDEAVSGTERAFRDTVLHGFPVTQETVRVFDHDIIRAVWKTKGSLADARYTEAVKGRIKGMVKIIAIKEDDDSPGVEPTVDAIQNQSYPVSIPLTLYYDGGVCTRELIGFVDFCARRGLGPHYAKVGGRHQ
jgi:phosphate transport system substrate-binding protein